jgi:hypothetical protein
MVDSRDGRNLSKQSLLVRARDHNLGPSVRDMGPLLLRAGTLPNHSQTFLLEILDSALQKDMNVPRV